MLVAALTPAVLVRPTPSLDGTWGGTVDVGTARPPGTASGALAQSGRGVKGSLTIDAGAASGVFTVTGTLRGKHAVLAGKHGKRRLRWKARYDPKTQSWRGPMVQRVALGSYTAGSCSRGTRRADPPAAATTSQVS